MKYYMRRRFAFCSQMLILSLDLMPSIGASYALEICFLLTDAHFVAGPHALHRGFQSFMADQGVIVQNVSTDSARAQH